MTPYNREAPQQGISSGPCLGYDLFQRKTHYTYGQQAHKFFCILKQQDSPRLQPLQTHTDKYRCSVAKTAQSPVLDLPALVYGLDSHLQSRTNYLQTIQMYKLSIVTKFEKIPDKNKIKRDKLFRDDN